MAMQDKQQNSRRRDRRLVPPHRRKHLGNRVPSDPRHSTKRWVSASKLDQRRTERPGTEAEEPADAGATTAAPPDRDHRDENSSSVRAEPLPGDFVSAGNPTRVSAKREGSSRRRRRRPAWTRNRRRRRLPRRRGSWRPAAGRSGDEWRGEKCRRMATAEAAATEKSPRRPAAERRELGGRPQLVVGAWRPVRRRVPL